MSDLVDTLVFLSFVVATLVMFYFGCRLSLWADKRFTAKAKKLSLEDALAPKKLTPSEGGCFFCARHAGWWPMFFSSEFDAYFHVECARRYYREGSAEAEIIASHDLSAVSMNNKEFESWANQNHLALHDVSGD